MKLKINGVVEKIENEKFSIQDLLRYKDVKMPEMVSVQLNEIFVDRKKYSQIYLHDGDIVDFLYYMGGGEL